MTTSEIITIGTEIMLGQITDSNTPYIANALTEKGIQVLFQTSVGDDKELLKSALKIAAERVDLIIITGGLGPTANDVTREALSDFFGVSLVLDGESYTHVQKIVESRHRKVTDADKKQAMVP
ncbi:MAG: competence/damage-inducible protein A, partial [Planctomycetota bacterium]